MTRLVLDASVALKWSLSPEFEPDAGRATQLLRAAQSGLIELLAPPHFIAEVLAVVSRQEPVRLSDTIEIMFALNLTTRADRETHERSARLSVSLQHHLFDTLYHAIAIAEGAVLVTADERYFDKARNLGNIKLLKDFVT